VQDFVQLWVYLSATPLFGLTLTLAVYVSVQVASMRLGAPAWANPVPWTVAVIALVLLASGTAYPTYFSGAQFIHFLLGPAVVALAWPLWQRREELRQRWRALLAASLIGGAVAGLSAVALGALMGLPGEVLASLTTKSVTAPVAMGIAEKIGGIPALAAVFAVLTGMIGALGGKYIFDALGIHSMEARGFALGTCAHGIGAARALQVDRDAGVYASLGLGLQVILASLWMPLVYRLF
jgi:predicted murein hydrolase (TIGR00659 family)